jgi:hypothetical protein
MKLIISTLALCVLSMATPALAQHGHDDPHARGARRHSPPPRHHDIHHYHQGDRWHGHPLVSRNGRWGYVNPSGIFVHISL